VQAVAGGVEGVAQQAGAAPHPGAAGGAGAGDLPGLPGRAFEDLDEDVGGLVALGLGDGALDELADALEAAPAKSSRVLRGGFLHAGADIGAGVGAQAVAEAAGELVVAVLSSSTRRIANQVSALPSSSGMRMKRKGAEGLSRMPDSMYQAPSCSMGCM
jgi:hypothetical protein